MSLQHRLEHTVLNVVKYCTIVHHVLMLHVLLRSIIWILVIVQGCRSRVRVRTVGIRTAAAAIIITRSLILRHRLTLTLISLCQVLLRKSQMLLIPRRMIRMILTRGWNRVRIWKWRSMMSISTSMRRNIAGVCVSVVLRHGG
jgi:hypothetical protein